MTETREAYTRTSGDLLVGGPINPSETPAVWWIGSDGGGNWAGEPIGPNGPWSGGGWGTATSVVTRALSLITGPLTAAPFKRLELGYGGRPLTRPPWITDPCRLRPDARSGGDVLASVGKLSRGALWATWIRDACLWGTGALLCQQDEEGQPLAGTLRIVTPGLLSVERSTEDGSLRWVIGNQDARLVFNRDGYATVGGITYRLVTLRNPHGTTNPEGHTPGVLEMHPAAFRLAGQIQTYTSGTFRSGIPAGYLKVDNTMNSMTQEQADDLKRRWMDSHGGDRRSIAVLNAFTSFVPLNLSPVDAALGEVTRLSIAEVAFAFGLDPEVLGTSLSNSATYKNAQEYWSRHRDFGLAPWIAAVEDTLTSLLPGTQGVKVDLDRFSNPPLKERVETGKLAVEAGLITVDEWRELEGLPPLPKPEPVVVPPALAPATPAAPEGAPGQASAPSPASVPAARARRPAALR